jgi:hypothetical protein
VGLALCLLKSSPFQGQGHVADVEELIVDHWDSAVQIFLKNCKLQPSVEFFPLFLHLSIDFTANMLVGTHYGVPTVGLAGFLLSIDEALAGELQKGDSDGNTHQDH